jgi:S1-C subfamily serine protease
VWLRVLSGADAGRTVEIPAEQSRSFVLGRVEGCDLVIRDEGASRHHAELRAEPAGGLRVRDLGSANGTFVDDKRIEEAMLSGGEELRIAGVEIAVMAHAPEQPGGGADAPTWSVVSRLVDHRTRGARRATWVALGAAALALAAVAFVLVVGGGGGDDDRSVPQVVRRLAPSTVLVEALRGDRRTATGSGWVLDARGGLVVTAAHVVNEGVRYRVAIDGEVRPAKLVGSAPCEDLALLRLPGGVAGRRSARLGKGADLEQGETVVALGYPASAAATDEVTSTRGVVSSASTTFRDPSPDVPGYREAVQTDTALNPGYSGGPLADLDGRIVGVNAAARTTGSDGRPLQGQNYAIGIDRARAVLGDLRRGSSVGWTGATFGYPTTEELLERRLPPGLYLTGAVPGTPAARAGLGGRGEVLAALDGRPLGPSLSSYCAAVAGRPGGRQVKLTLARPGGGKPREVMVALA